MIAHLPLDSGLNELSGIIVDASYKIHSRLGPGLLESVYECLLARELCSRGHAIERQKPISFVFDGVPIEDGFRPDLIVDRAIIVEVKAVEKVPLVFERQLLTYMKILNCRLGLLINFGAPYIRDGIKRMIF